MTKEVVNAIFDCVYQIPDKSQFDKLMPDKYHPETLILLQDDYFRSFMQMLHTMADFNRIYRFEKYGPLFPLIHPIINLEYNSEGTDIFLSLVLAVKELYNLNDKKLCSIMKLVD